jgi:hypothetical protein
MWSRASQTARVSAGQWHFGLVVRLAALAFADTVA